jgi:hypothetical protein
VHALVSWTGCAEWNGVRATLKRRMGAALSKTFHRPGPWFSRGGKDSRKQVTDPKHFAYLVETYLPKLTHRGTHYCERRGRWRQ